MFTRSGSERTAGRAGPGGEQATACALDHLHTERPVLAGFASRSAGQLPAGPTGRNRRRKATGINLGLRLLGAATGALLLLGTGGALSSGPAGAGTGTAPNSVSAFGGAEDLGPDTGLALVSPLLGITSTPTGDGYWLVAGDGGVFTYGDADFHGSTGGLALRAPVVGMAATPTGDGYWLVARDGGVFAFGDAAFLGSAGSLPLTSPIVAIAPTPSGGGYWLASRDGGVFAFGDAAYLGSPSAAPLSQPVVGMVATPSGDGYWLVAHDGGVFAFGDADFSGSAAGLTGVAVGLAPDPDGTGYWIAASDGSVYAFDAPAPDAATTLASAPAAPTVGISARPGGGYWLARGETPEVVLPSTDPNHPFLVCTRSHESSHTPPLYNDGYGAVSSSGTYRGAYQFSRSTWDSTARHASRPDLVGVDPAAAAPADQDFLALDLYHSQGASPWGGRCAGL